MTYDKKISLSEALALLPKSKFVHVYKQHSTGGMFWIKHTIESLLTENEDVIFVPGIMSTTLHGIYLPSVGFYIETDRNKLKKIL